LKLRVLDNSIRLRLTRGEVTAIGDDSVVRGRVRFAGNNTFVYMLESSSAIVRPEAYVSNNVLTVRVPQMDIRRWARSEEISIQSEQLLDDGDHLKILVEKDFHCLSPREGEDESDMFPHPETGTC
jgi:hypothetical protein